jgi:hypothetical protein
MTASHPAEFARLLSFQRAKHHFPPFTKMTRRKAKSLGKKPQGRKLIGLETIFLRGEYKK